MSDNDVETTAPNLFMMTGEGGLQITYSSSSFQGGPQLSYHDAHRSLFFAAGEITYSDSPLGVLVTVEIEVVPDRHHVTATIPLPEIHLSGHQNVPFRSVLLATTNRTSLIGPRALTGALQTYTCTELSGVAQFVLF